MADDELPDGADHEESGQSKPGKMRFQDASTTPREPTLAERRARERAAEEERERLAQEEVEQAALARKKKIRKRVLIGGGVTVGLVGIIAAGYALSSPSQEVTARCTDDSGVVVNDDYCNVNSAYYAGNGGYYNPGGFFIFPGGRQYHYYYGGSGDIGQRAVGGTTTAPSGNTTVKTSSGSTISRGGFGVKSGSSGSSAGGSGSSSGGDSGSSSHGSSGKSGGS
ncbi:hypothetical protein [Kutzneria sp. NPDC052558]|uniref:hypothetical protein n=1 Tax=Kutzneria sp. NPDC052558 TaxID=3364121 RepID=UPI0037C8ACE5